ncbi:hypothetical protein [Halovivax cerinus]|uniref:DUF2268 domain-containing protein n=1 Tax=Halovivax cerinus TaxID=1487865 RepID=A0ABD5NJH1_9EURY|nr:hypothetical protein [Halovivax cerinus]
MQFDASAARLFRSYATGQAPVEDLVAHPAYVVARQHAALLGRTLDANLVAEAVAGEADAFPDSDTLQSRWEAIDRLLDTVDDRATDWIADCTTQLTHVIPGAETGDLPLYLGIGYETGIGLADGAYLDVARPFYRENPARVRYVALHESTHVCYDRRHDLQATMAALDLDEPTGQRRFFETLLHTEAYAVYTAGIPWRADDGVADVDHPMCCDYHAVADDSWVHDLVDQYDSLRESFDRGETLSHEALMRRTFGGLRLPYRIGCALLDRVESEHGMAAVRDGFAMDAVSFCEKFDTVLDRYRQ